MTIHHPNVPSLSYSTCFCIILKEIFAPRIFFPWRNFDTIPFFSIYGHLNLLLNKMYGTYLSLTELRSVSLPMLKSSISILLLILLAACSFTGKENLRKSERYTVNFDLEGWSSIAPKGADHAIISDQTKSILILNSLCGLYEATSLNHLTSNMMGGIENISIQDEQERKLVNRKSLRTYAAGEIDGVPISLIIETVRKNSCIYDFALISSTKEVRAKDEKSFNQLLSSFHIP